MSSLDLEEARVALSASIVVAAQIGTDWRGYDIDGEPPEPFHAALLNALENGMACERAAAEEATRELREALREGWDRVRLAAICAECGTCDEFHFAGCAIGQWEATAERLLAAAASSSEEEQG